MNTPPGPSEGMKVSLLWVLLPPLIRSHGASASIFNHFSRFGSWSPLSVCHLTHAYLTSVLLHHLCCIYFIVAIKLWSPSVLWNMLCVRYLFDVKIAALLSHINLMLLALIRPERRRVPSTARPDMIPPNSDLYDVIYLPGLSSGPHPRSMSSSSVAISQLWKPTQNKTELPVAILRSTSLVLSHCIDV
jgi:hypothetical protein